MVMSLHTNMHVHARSPETRIFKEVMPIYARDNYLVMPVVNLPEKTTYELIENYWTSTKDITFKVNPRCHVKLMIALDDGLTAESLDNILMCCKKRGAEIGGAKLFPRGQSTNAGNAAPLSLAFTFFPVLAKYGIPLNLHMEHPDTWDVTEKEADFVRDILPKISKEASKSNLRIVLEHISTKESVDYIKAHSDTMCTITPHHMLFCLEDLGIQKEDDVEAVLRKKFQFAFCKPTPQWRDNMTAVKNFFKSGSPQIMLGSDSAPHKESAKLSPDPSMRPAGVYIEDVRGAYIRALVGDVASEKEVNIAKSLLRRYDMNAVQYYAPELTKAYALEYYMPRPVGMEQASFTPAVLPFKAGQGAIIDGLGKYMSYRDAQRGR